MMAAPLPEVDRRRLLEVRGLHPAVPVLVLHPLMTVVTGFGRDASDTVVECLGRLGAPLGPSVTGTVEIGGRILDLPGALADPDSRPVVVRSPMLVSELVRRRAAHAAADVSQRAARVSRREAGLARRDQLVDRLERLSNRADALDRQLHPTGEVGDNEIRRLLHAARHPDLMEPNPIVAALIDEWEALVAERKASTGGPTVERAESNLEAIRARIAERRLGSTDGGAHDVLSAEGVARVQQSHAVVERLAASLGDGRRAERRAAGREIAAALDAEHEALGQLGFESYAAFLLALAEGRAEEDEGHELAALQTAEAALARAHDRESAFVALSERELDLRTRVARLLGRLPGPDVGSELRSGREKGATPSALVEELEATLRRAEVPVGDDAIAAAERWLADADTRRSQRAALAAELAEIESEGARLDEQLEAAEAELATAERELIAGVSGSLAGREAPLMLSTVAPDELTATFAALLDQNGSPVVVGECFAELSPQSSAALLELLNELSRRRQVIIVTEHEYIGRWAQSLGIDGSIWTPVDAEHAQRVSPVDRSPADTTAGTQATDHVPDSDDLVAFGDVEALSAGAVEASPVQSEPPKAGPALFDVEAVEAAEAAEARGAVEETPVEQKMAKKGRKGIAKPPVGATPEREAPASPVPAQAPAPSPAGGPSKASGRRRRKQEAAPPPAPWEGRFDTSRDRPLPERKAAVPPPPGTEPLAVCALHRGVLTRTRCSKCGVPACDECLVSPKSRRKKVCVECSILRSGVRERRRRH
jgi:hypothetical protein